MVAKKKPTKKSPTKKAARKPKKLLQTRVAVILDRSSSMLSMRAEALSAFNKQVEAVQKKVKGMETKFTFVTFSTVADEPTIFNQSVEKIKPLTEDQYVPDGMTAMYDAVGFTLDKLTALPEYSDKDCSFLVVIISDGQENNSRHFTAEAIASRVKALTETGRFTFTYMGANQDLRQVSRTLNIPMQNTMAFVANAKGMDQASKTHVGATVNYMSLRSTGAMASTNFYGGDNKDTDKSGG